LLHTPMRISTFMTTDPLSSASSILKRGSLSEHLDIPGTFSEHPASPVLLTSKGPQKAQATLRFGRENQPPIAETCQTGRKVRSEIRNATRSAQPWGPLLAQPLGRASRGKGSCWAGKALLPRWQFEDRLRRMPSQRCLSCIARRREACLEWVPSQRDGPSPCAVWAGERGNPLPPDHTSTKGGGREQHSSESLGLQLS